MKLWLGTMTTFVAVVFGGTVGLAGSMASAAQDGPDASPVFGVQLPPGYREWHVISVAHEAGALNDIRVVLGNDVALRAFRQDQRPFPDGTILARIAWKLEPSQRNNAIFGKSQSFVAGDPTNVQVEQKDSIKYAATGGWGYGQFENGRVNHDSALIKTCNACHARLPKSEDLIFTAYAR